MHAYAFISVQSATWHLNTFGSVCRQKQTCFLAFVSQVQYSSAEDSLFLFGFSFVLSPFATNTAGLG